MNEQREHLLMKGIKNDGKLTFEMAREVYSSKQSTKNALEGLDEDGFIEQRTVGTKRVKGVFDVVSAPPELIEQFRD